MDACVRVRACVRMCMCVCVRVRVLQDAAGCCRMLTKMAGTHKRPAMVSGPEHHPVKAYLAANVSRKGIEALNQFSLAPLVLFHTRSATAKPEWSLQALHTHATIISL